MRKQEKLLCNPKFNTKIPFLLIALTAHEYAHVRAALFLGNPTGRDARRLALMLYMLVMNIGLALFDLIPLAPPGRFPCA
jgi:hypothetical protein